MGGIIIIRKYREGWSKWPRTTLSCLQERGVDEILNLPSGIFPPDAERRHSTSGIGSPPTRHWNVTEAPSTTTWLWGPRIRNGFTGMIIIDSGWSGEEAERQGQELMVLFCTPTLRERLQETSATGGFIMHLIPAIHGAIEF